VLIPQATVNESSEISRETRTPSCLTAIQNSEKSNGQTLKNQSSDPVTQNPAETAIEHIALS
jgi:hypothetical protein